jgi:hypothetical protein
VRLTRILLTLAVVVVLGAAGTWLALRAGAPGTDPATAARTTFPDLQPVAEEATLSSLQGLRPAAGTVVEAPGPFDDRFHFDRLRFDGTTVRGTTTITSDVSDLLELEVLAAFYDEEGALLSTARDTYHLDESHPGSDHAGVPAEARTFAIAVPEGLREDAVAAAVGVAVLVNE